MNKTKLDKKKVNIIIVNWNGWKDTIECLESIFRSDYSHFRVIVCDNNSTDDSYENIRNWAKGEIDAGLLPEENVLRHLSFPPVSKPIHYIEFDRVQAEARGGPKATEARLILIQVGANLGFAGGNNVGIRYSLASGNDFDFLWILNNDTVIENDTLRTLVEKAESLKTNGKKVGVIGSKLLFYGKPKQIQGVGGKINKWFATCKHIGVMEEDNGQYDNKDIKMDYVIGSSMFINKEFLLDTGLMSEDYFLYFEEIDLAKRAEKKGWKLGFCWESKVYHKEGATIGSSLDGRKRSKLADYYALKNRIVFTKKFHPKCLFWVYLGFIIVMLNRIKRGQFDRLSMIIDILRNKKIRYPIK